MNPIPVGGELYPVKWSFKIPFTMYWIVFLSKICVIEIVTKHFDNVGYYFNRIGFNERPEYYIQ